MTRRQAFHQAFLWYRHRLQRQLCWLATRPLPLIRELRRGAVYDPTYGCTRRAD